MTINFDPNEQTTSDEGGSEARQITYWHGLPYMETGHGKKPEPAC